MISPDEINANSFQCCVGNAYTVRVSYEPDERKRTCWHPTEETGPFKTLTRGHFKKWSHAQEWAYRHLGASNTWIVVTEPLFEASYWINE